MKVGLYIRVSSQEQATEGYSVGEQEKRMRSYCEAKGWTVYKVYVDAAYTGANMERPGLKRMISDSTNGFMDAVLVYKLDRLSRSQKDTLYLIEDVFLANSVEFISITENFDSSTPFGRAMIGLLSVFAQLERDTIKERMGLGRQARQDEGKWIGSGTPPIGYRYVDDLLVVDDYEAMQVRELFRMYNMHIPHNRIINILNNNGYRTSYGKWKKRTLKPLIANRTYIGEVSYKGVWKPGIHVPIIDAETFEKAQAIMYERDQSNKRKTKFVSPIGQLIKCGHCGNDYYTKPTDRKDKDGNIIRYFTCYKRSSYNSTWKDTPKEERCKNKNWRVEVLEKEILDEIRKLGLHPEEVKVKERVDDTTIKIKTLNDRIAEIDKQLDRFLDLYASGTFDINKVNEKANPLNEERAAIMHELSNIRPDNRLSKKDAVKLALSLDEVINKGDPDEIYSIVHELIDSIVIDGEDAHIYWAFS